MSAPRSYKRLLEIGGLSGLLTGIAFLPVVGVGGNNPEPGIFTSGTTSSHQTMAQFLAQFSQNLAPLSEMVGLTVIMLAFIPLFLALYVLLRDTNPTSALIGGVFGVVWAVSTIMFLIMRYWTLSTSAFLYSSAAPADQAAVVAAAEATFYSVYGLFYVGGIFGSIAFIATGIAMFGATPFRRGYAWMAVAFGLLYAVSMVDIAASSQTVSNPFFVVLLIVFLGWSIVIGQKLFRLSRTM